MEVFRLHVAIESLCEFQKPACQFAVGQNFKSGQGRFAFVEKGIKPTCIHEIFQLLATPRDYASPQLFALLAAFPEFFQNRNQVLVI